MALSLRFYIPALAALAMLSGCEGAASFNVFRFGDSEPASSTAPGTTGPGANGTVTSELASVSRVRRLSAHEYDNALFDLLRDSSRPGRLLLPTDDRNPFDNDYTRQLPSDGLIASLDLLARDAADRLLADPARRDAVVGCTPTSPTDSACFTQFVKRLGRRALRRPLSADELTRYQGLLELANEQGDFYVAVQTAVMIFLQHHEFIYSHRAGSACRRQARPLQAERLRDSHASRVHALGEPS